MDQLIQPFTNLVWMKKNLKDSIPATIHCWSQSWTTRTLIFHLHKYCSKILRELLKSLEGEQHSNHWRPSPQPPSKTEWCLEACNICLLLWGLYPPSQGWSFMLKVDELELWILVENAWKASIDPSLEISSWNPLLTIADDAWTLRKDSAVQLLWSTIWDAKWKETKVETEVFCWDL